MKLENRRTNIIKEFKLPFVNNWNNFGYSQQWKANMATYDFGEKLISCKHMQCNIFCRISIPSLLFLVLLLLLFSHACTHFSLHTPVINITNEWTGSDKTLASCEFIQCYVCIFRCVIIYRFIIRFICLFVGVNKIIFRPIRII